MSLLPDGLLDIMQCLRCGGDLVEQAEPPALVCRTCSCGYPIAEGGIPVMLEEAAFDVPTQDDGRG